jgi:CHAD domain-containing protein
MNVILGLADYTDEEIHLIRKNLKDMIYVIEIFEKRYAGTIGFWKKKQVKEAVELSDRLGAFNDGCINLSFLQPGKLNKLSVEEQGILYTVKLNWLKDKKALKDNLMIDLVSVIRRLLPGKIKLK